jgi:hypothetical protein
MQSATTDLALVDSPERSWNRGFLAYLKARGRLADLQFFSFEHYPFDDICGDIHGKLVAADALLDDMLRRLAAEGLPDNVPLVISEYGFSAFSGQAMVEMPSALLQADIVARFLSQRGAAAYMFGYGPNVPINQRLPCAGFGNMAPFLADAQGQAADPLPSFHTSRLLSSVWLQPGHRLHRLYAARVQGLDAAQADQVVAYAVLRPDGRLATLILNRSPERAFTIRLDGAADVHQYGPAQYRWRANGAQGRPALNLPPARWRAAQGTDIALPADSLTVVVARRTGTPPAEAPGLLAMPER